MKIIFRLFAFGLFLVFFGFALKNTDEVVLHLFWNATAKAPLILLLLAFFIAGAVLGVLAMTSTVLRYRRLLVRQKKEIEQREKTAEAVARVRAQPPLPDTVVEHTGL
jgi:putative membrane protein